ncbi:response regulator [Pseudomonas sp. Eqa60]|uniref:response regulator n=1 Tax=Pseudomonas sp. Eqa60 TaxID=2799184 RepID=UPI001BB3A65C|nr:response regulator [Pseudomonas sp. Eqa60]
MKKLYGLLLRKVKESPGSIGIYDVEVSVNGSLTREQALQEGELVLVAEDHSISRNLIQQQLKLLGYVSDFVKKGVEVINAIERISYGLTISDYHVPNLDGLELFRNVRTIEGHRFSH